MNFTARVAVATMAVVGFAGAASADTGNPASDTAQASVTVIAPITMTKTLDLNFGNITNTGGGTASISPDGDRSRSGGVQLVAGPSSAASFNVLAANGYSYNLTNEVSDLVGVGSAAGDTIELTLDHASSGTGTGGAEVTRVGGEIKLDANDSPGSYSGSFDLIATYQ
jgi:Domain of unknown function (DUF4402)